MIVYRWTGIESKALRQAMLLSVEKFATTLKISTRTVTNWEIQGAEARLRPTSRELLDNTLTAATPEIRARFERALAGVGSQRHEPGLGSYSRQTAAENRLLPVPCHQSDLVTAFDRIRLVVDQTLSKCTVTSARVDLMWERVADRIQSYTTTPPATALAAIAPDLLEVQTIAVERQPASLQARLSESSAALGLLTADALMKLGEIGRANYWYGTATAAADDSLNRQLQATARAQHSMLHYYYGGLTKTIVLARAAQDLAPSKACDASALAAAAEARALARLGDHHGAEQAMNKARQLTDALPNNSGDEAFKFTAKRMLLYLSGTLTYLRQTTRARRAQDEALSLYRSTPVVIDPALIQLDAALGYAMSGSAADGCQLAEHVLNGLPVEHRTRIISTRALDLVKALPAEHRALPSAKSLRELIHTETTA